MKKPSGASTSSSLSAAAPRVLIPCTLALGAVFACSATDPVSSIELGVLQVRISSVSLPDSVGIGDTLIAHLSGRPDSGNCFSESHTDVERDTIHVMITVWANARLWVGDGPPPPCGVVGYRYEGMPPFRPGWFRVIANQPGGTQMVDSVRIVQ